MRAKFFDRFRNVSVYHFNKRMNEIMSAISDFAQALKVHQDRVAASITGITNDLTELKRKLEEINNNPGTISSEDQALLDQALALTAGLADQLENVDAMTPPVVPQNP